MKRNPFQSETSLLNSNYCLAVERELKYSPRDPEMGRLALEIFHELQQMILDEGYACTGAQAAFRQESYRLGVYPEMGSEAATAGLAHDLFTFLQERRRLDTDFSTFIAVFAGPAGMDELEFETMLWRQLQMLHDLDAEHHPWDAAVSTDPADPRFSYSFAGEACVVVGLHPGSSRPARRLPYPALVFNAHEQFERLRETGAYERMQTVIRQRDAEAHGSINPMLDDFGATSEARQYAGRAVEADWTCPFHARPAAMDAGGEVDGAGSADAGASPEVGTGGTSDSGAAAEVDPGGITGARAGAEVGAGGASGADPFASPEAAARRDRG